MWDLVIAFTVVALAHGHPRPRVELYRLSYHTRFTCEAASSTADLEQLVAIRKRSVALRRVRAVDRITTDCEERSAWPL